MKTEWKNTIKDLKDYSSIKRYTFEKNGDGYLEMISIICDREDFILEGVPFLCKTYEEGKIVYHCDYTRYGMQR